MKLSWIEARLKGSPESAWTILRETLLSDIDEWRRLTKADAGSLLVSSEDWRITVASKEEDQLEDVWVTVQKKETRITVRRPSKSGAPQEVDIIPRLNQDGECRLWLGEEELEFGQASRRILEPVLFR
jgi:hypothetical protein